MFNQTIAMKNKYYILFIKVLVVITYLILIIYLLKYFEYLSFDFKLFKIILGMVILLSITLATDALRNRVYNKWFWAWSLFMMPLIGAPFYLLQRNKLIRLNEKYILFKSNKTKENIKRT